jgi:hypothetical protein
MPVARSCGERIYRGWKIEDSEERDVAGNISNQGSGISPGAFFVHPPASSRFLPIEEL